MSAKDIFWMRWGDGISDEFASVLGKGWKVTLWDLPDVPQRAINTLQPFAVLFDCDYPTRECLQCMLDIRLLYPALPMVIASYDASAELATWALRVRAWDYLVKPIATPLLATRLNLLSQAATVKLGYEQALPRSLIEESLQHLEFEETPLTTRLAVKFVKEYYFEPLSLDAAARHCGMSRWHFSRVFRREHGITFQEFLIRERVKRACFLLRQEGRSVTDVGLSVGFNDLSNFTRMFQRYVGTRPSQYRRAWNTELKSRAPNEVLEPQDVRACSRSL